MIDTIKKKPGDRTLGKARYIPSGMALTDEQVEKVAGSIKELMKIIN